MKKNKKKPAKLALASNADLSKTIWTTGSILQLLELLFYHK
ncbi:Uncharacterised protein [Staphylococcus saprophyticus]|nr:hypothetical protein [Staphylococcus saprophyticus]SUM78693.1 Uncharacterised protein [Staphylococcus saprophyticus]